jgi:hypothetical protein
MIKETINAWNGERIVLTISADGYCYCPVCGEQSKDKEWRPYNINGSPSYDICSCGFEYGFDDGGEPPHEESWENFRQKWLADEVRPTFGRRLSKTEKLEQLKNLGPNINVC